VLHAVLLKCIELACTTFVEHSSIKSRDGVLHEVSEHLSLLLH